MSRVSYVMMHPEGANQMRDAIRDALNQLFEELSEQAGSTIQDILEVSLVANPIMHHLVLGIDPVNLGGAPFALDRSRRARYTRAGCWPAHSSRGPSLYPALYCRPCRSRCGGSDSRREPLSR